MNTSPPPESSSRSAAAPTRTTPGTIVIGSTCWAVMTLMIADPQTPRPSCVYYCTLRTLTPAIHHTKVHLKALDARLGALPCQESWGLAAMTALAAGLAPRLAPQGLRVRFGQAIAGRWLRGVSRRRSHLPLQLRDTRILAGDAGLQIHQMRLQRDHQVGELLICWLRHKYILPHQANKSMQTRRPTASNRNRQAQKT